MSGVGTLTGIALESIPEITADKDYGLGENRCKEEKGRGGGNTQMKKYQVTVITELKHSSDMQYMRTPNCLSCR